VIWETIALGDIFKVTSGGTPSRKRPEFYENGNIHWVKTGDLHNKYVETASEFITKEALDSSSTKLYPPGTVLIAMYGATIGACSILNIKACTNQACAAFTPNDKVDSQYLYYLLKSKKDTFVRAGAGGAQPNISATFLKQFKIPLPALSVQKQIAKVLEKADTLRGQCQKMEQELNTFAQSVFLDMFGDPVKNPKGWEKRKIKDLVADFQGGKSIAASENQENSGLNRVLKISAVTWGEFKPEESKPLPNSYEPPNEHFVKANDLLFSRANTTELVGATSLVFKTPNNILLPDKLWRFVWHKDNAQSQVFMWQLLSNKGVRNELGKISTGSGGSMKNISKSKLYDFEVIYPEVALQLDYEAKFLKIREQLSAVYGLQKEHSDNFNSLMQRAFKGELNLKDVA